MATLATLVTKLKRIVPDKALRFVNADHEKFIEKAVREYSKTRPRVRDAELTGDGTKQEFTVPSDWIIEFSVITSLEFPIDEIPPVFINLQDNLLIILKSDLEIIQLFTITLGSAEKARIKYIAKHTVNGSTSTVPDIDEDALVDLAGSHYASALAAFYAENRDDTVDADVADHLTQAATFEAIAGDLKDKYIEHMESEDVEDGVIEFFDLDIDFSWQRDLLFHQRRFR